MLYAEKVEEHTKIAIFISKILRFLSQIGLFSLFLCLRFLCFSQYKSLNFLVSLSLLWRPAYVLFYDFSQDKSLIFFYSTFFMSLYCIQERWKSTQQVQFLSENSMSIGSFSLIFWFTVKFFHLRQPSRTCSFFPIPTFLGFYDFSQDKNFNFFGCSSFILFSEFSHYEKLKFVWCSWALHLTTRTFGIAKSSMSTSLFSEFLHCKNLLHLALHFGFILYH